MGDAAEYEIDPATCPGSDTRNTETTEARNQTATNTTQINLGALAPTIAEQLPTLPAEQAAKFERFRVSINILRIHGLLGDADCRKVEHRIVRRIQQVLK